MNKIRISIIAVLAMLFASFAVALPASSASAAPVSTTVTQITPTVTSVITVPRVVMPTYSGNWCGFGTYCVYFNRLDQTAIHTGGAVLIGAALCRIGVPCVIVGLVLAVAGVYLNNRGYCSNKLKMTYWFFPYPHAEGRCV